jgi:hypothetical protein
MPPLFSAQYGPRDPSRDAFSLLKYIHALERELVQIEGSLGRHLTNKVVKQPCRSWVLHQDQRLQSKSQQFPMELALAPLKHGL